MYMGQTGVYTHTFLYEKKPGCMVCGGASLELTRPSTSTLQELLLAQMGSAPGRGASSFDREAPVRFGSVTVWGWNGSSGSGFRFRRFLCKKGFLCFSRVQQGGTVPVPVSVPGKRFQRFRFHFRFREKRFRRFRFPVPVRFLSHPALNQILCNPAKSWLKSR